MPDLPKIRIRQNRHYPCVAEEDAVAAFEFIVRPSVAKTADEEAGQRRTKCDGSLVPACQQGDPKVGEPSRLRSKGLVMRYYFLALGTLVVVCFGCHIDGQQLIDKGEYVAPPPA